MFRRKKRSSLKVFRFPTSAHKSLLVVAMTRTLILHGRFAADPVDLPFLQRPQQLGLKAGVHLADFVQQDGAPVLRPRTCRSRRSDRAGEGAASHGQTVPIPKGASGIAAQFSATNGPSRPAGGAGGCDAQGSPCRCRLAPVSSTDASAGATCSARRRPSPASPGRARSSRAVSPADAPPASRRSGRGRAAAAGSRARRPGWPRTAAVGICVDAAGHHRNG